MKESICGLDCAETHARDSCSECVTTGGRPFGGVCAIASCCLSKKKDRCGSCQSSCELKNRLISELNALGIEDKKPITEITGLFSSYVNLEFTLPNGKKMKFWNDNDIILGFQTRK